MSSSKKSKGKTKGKKSKKGKQRDLCLSVFESKAFSKKLIKI